MKAHNEQEIKQVQHNFDLQNAGTIDIAHSRWYGHDVSANMPFSGECVGTITRGTTIYILLKFKLIFKVWSLAGWYDIITMTYFMLRQSTEVRI